MPHAPRLLSLALAISALFAVPAAAGAAFPRYDPPNPDKIDFVVNCKRAATGTFDPIVYPGETGTAHDHIFAGNRSINPTSDPFALAAGGETTCDMGRNLTSYWAPRLLADGVPVDPGLDEPGSKRFEFRAYYRAATTTPSLVQPIPFGLRIIAGASTATSPQDPGIAGFQCRNLTDGNTVAKQVTPPDCAKGDYLEASVVFPNCWDGIHLDSDNHKSHMAYAKATADCPDTHPVRLPRLTLAMRYPTDAFLGKTVSIATNGAADSSRYTLHADAMFAWDPATMRTLVVECIHKQLACEGVSETRLPPGVTLPPAEWPSPPLVDPDPMPDPFPSPVPTATPTTEPSAEPSPAETPTPTVTPAATPPPCPATNYAQLTNAIRDFAAALTQAFPPTTSP